MKKKIIMIIIISIVLISVVFIWFVWPSIKTSIDLDCGWGDMSK